MKLISLIIITLFTQNIMAQKTNNLSLKEEEKTTIKFIGEYYTGRGPCQHLPNGTRRWRLIAGFKVKAPLLGNIKVKHIEIDPTYYSSNSTGVDTLLETGKDYMVTLKLDKERVALLENKDTQFTHLNLITNDEIVEVLNAEAASLRYGEKIIISSGGYFIVGRSNLIEDTLLFEPPLEGAGGATWIFEISNNELVIIDFRWGVRPGQTPQLHTKYIRTIKRTNKLITADLEYKTYSSDKDATNKENYVHLVGHINEDIIVDIKRKYPYSSSIRDTEFVDLLKKYHLKTKKQ